jgi:hypothetical protein
MLANGFAYDTAGFCGSFGSANILRQRKWEAQRANQPPVSDELFLREEDIGRRHHVCIRCTNFFIKLGNLIEAECDRCIICGVMWRYLIFSSIYLIFEVSCHIDKQLSKFL